MEPVAFTLAFVIALTAYVALHVRAGLSQDAHWSRQQMLGTHGIRLGLSTRDWETESLAVPAQPVPQMPATEPTANSRRTYRLSDDRIANPSHA